MGNYYFTTKKAYHNLRLDELLPKMVESLFKGGLKVVGEGSEFEIHAQDAAPDDRPLFYVGWLRGRQVGGKHGRGPWAQWAQTLLMETLALHLDGKMGDEGVTERWAPNPYKYPTYLKWFDTVIYPDFPEGSDADYVVRSYHRAPEWVKSLQVVIPPPPTPPQISRFDLLRDL